MFTSVMIGLAVTPSVRAQFGMTSILNLSYPSQAVLQNGAAQVTVTFTVYYSQYINPQGYLLIAIYDAHTSNAHEGSAASTPDPCQPLSGTLAKRAVCMVIPTGFESGSEDASFTLTFNSTQQYALTAAAGVVDYQGNAVHGSVSSSGFTITVTSPTPSTTTITNLQSPSRAILHNGLAQAAVTFTVDYSGLPSGGYVGFGVFYASTKKYVAGSGTSTPDPCMSLAGTTYVGDAACVTTPASSSGTESASFTLKFNSTQQYALFAVAIVTDTSHNLIAGSTSTSSFMISVTDKVQLTLTLPNSVTATVDGTSQTAGNVNMALKLGQHTISVPETVPLTSGSQLRFDHWSDGSKTANRTDDLENDTTLAATYVTQYRLSLTDPSATGAGWYDQGTTAQFSVPPSEPAQGIMGMLGATQNFQGWYENETSVTFSSSGSITMNAPHTLTPERTEDDTRPMIIIAIIAVIAVAVIGFAALRRKKKSGHAQPTVSPAPVAKNRAGFCRKCGAQLSPDSDFCGECGARKS